MQRKLWALGIVLILCLGMGVNTKTAVEQNEVNQELEWWDVYSRDKDHNGISDLLTWKLEQNEQFFDAGEARVFVRYDHHPTDYDVERLEQAGIEVTFRAQFIDLIGTTMPRDMIHEIANWNGVVMLDDIGKAVPDMNEAVPNMGVNQVWENYGLYGEGISIAIVDTGVDNAHVGLDDMDDNLFTNDLKVAAYYDAVQDSLICSPCQPGQSLDSGTHGTHVAGIAAGTGAGETAPDGTPYIGVAPKAHLVNVLSCCEGDIEDIIRGIEWTIENQKVIQPNIRVMTSSLGEQQVEFHIDNDGSSAWSQVSDAAVESGLVVTLSAGNEIGAITAAGCNTIDSPGDSRLPITVASLDKDLSLAIYSSRGYTSDGRVKPDVATIGSNIMAPNKGTGTGYTSKSGTSMATPLMAGIVALTLEANPDLTPAEVKDTLVAGYSIEREILDEGLITNDCSVLETRPDNEYGYGQADPLVFAEIAGMIDPDVSVNWTLAYVESEVNGTVVLEKPEIYNGTILKGTAITANKPTVGVEVKFGSSEWYPATDTSNQKNWATWEITIPEEVSKGNQTLAARLVLDGGMSMSAVNSFSVVLLDEYSLVTSINEGLSSINALFFFPAIILAAIAMGYIFTQPRKSKSNLEVEESGEDEFVWDNDVVIEGQNNLMTTMFGAISAKTLTLCALYTAQGIPSGFISYTLIAYLAQQGFSAAAIGNMLFWVYLPWVFKFLWGPFVDNYHYLPMGRRRPWILSAQAGMVVTVIIIALVPEIDTKITLLTALLFFHNCFASLQDVAVDGLAVDILSPEEFGKINGFMFGAKRFGTMIGGAGIGYFMGKYTSIGIAEGLFLTVPMLLLIMCLPAFIRERPGEKLFPWTEGDAMVKPSNEVKAPKSVKANNEATPLLAPKWDMGDHNAKSLSVDIGLLIALDLFLLLTIADFASKLWCHVLTVVAGMAYFVLLRNNTFGQQAFDLAPQKSDIVKALSLRAPLVGIILAMLTYFWEFLIPVLNVLFIQNLGWTDTEYVAVTGGSAVIAGILGTLMGGIIADRYGARRIASLFAVLTGLSIFTIALAEPLWENRKVMWWLIVIYPFFGAAMGISLISLFMNVTWPKVGATQFTLYMAMLNFGALFGLKMAGYFEENFTYTTTIMIGGTCQLLIAFVLPFIDPGQTRRELGNDF
jgi:subtilisin family serine protease/MFS family permease|tara:strand:+ start:559 stop:4065 length:3507 start_codon:yes stop_codon:yes gene_type:complete